MRILQINSVCGYGSTGRITADLCQAVKADGGKCVVAYGRKAAAQEVQAVPIGSAAGVVLHGILSRLTDRHGFYSTAATKRFLSWVDGFQPDMIHLHNIHGYYLNIELLFRYLKEIGLPVVWTLHDCWPVTGHCAYFYSVGCTRWKSGCHDCPQRKAYPTSLFADQSVWNYQKKKQLFTSLENLTIVTPSEWMAGIVRESFLGCYPVRVIPNGIDLTQFRHMDGDFRRRFGLQDKKIVLGAASIWEKRKGLDDFIALSELLGDNWQVVLVGLSERQKAALPKNILGICRTDSIQKLAELYSAADVYVNASTEETMGLTTAEALACGTPAVVYDATAVPETVDASCGAVVPCGDVAALAEAVRRMQKDEVSCRRRAEAYYDEKKQCMKYISLYHELVSQSEGVERG